MNSTAGRLHRHGLGGHHGRSGRRLGSIWETYRVMVHDRNTLRILHLAGQTRGVSCGKNIFARRPILQNWRVFFSDMTLCFISPAEWKCPTEFPSMNGVGGLQGHPVPVIKGEYNRFAHSGFFGNRCRMRSGSRRRTTNEGPFGEWTGYYASNMRPEPTMKVKRLYHRKQSHYSRCAADPATL